MTELRNPEIRLRAVEPGDVDTIYRWETAPDAEHIGWGEAPVSRQLVWQYVESYTADIYRDRQLRLIITLGDVPVGTIDLSDFDPHDMRAMVGIFVDAAYRRRGIATDALALIIDYATRQLGLHQVTALVARDNTASQHLFRAAGFRQSGMLRSWIRRGPTAYADVIILQRMLR